MSIEWLPPLDPVTYGADATAHAATHPMRGITRAVAAEVGAWTTSVAADVRGLFDGLADDWHTRHTPGRLDPLADALARGGVPADGPGTVGCLELGSGDGHATPLLTERFDPVVAIDLSARMLARAGAAAHRVQADGAALPLADHSVGVAVLMNMLLFPSELDRVLAFGGLLVWISSRSELTPIHLEPHEVAAALPGRWSGIASRVNTATWAVLRRG